MHKNNANDRAAGMKSAIKLTGVAALLLIGMGGMMYIDRCNASASSSSSNVEQRASTTEEESICEEFDVSIREPAGGVTPVGITVFLPGANVLGIGPKLDSYESTIRVLLEMNQLVIGFNRLSPDPLRPQRSHDLMAERVRDAVAAVLASGRHPNLGKENGNGGYSIVGHSLGGKVALMVAAKFDGENVVRVVALDPVDMLDPQFTATPPAMNLGDASARIYLRQSARRGFATPPGGRNAEAIRDAFPDEFADDDQFVLDAKARHMSYTDRTDEASVETRRDVHASIRELFDPVDDRRASSGLSDTMIKPEIVKIR
jgi:pimeloyl-ACP methyl ester carboxylesterase